MTAVLGNGRNNQLAATLIVAYTELEKTQIKEKWNLSSPFHEYYLTTLCKLIAMVKEEFRKVELKLEDKRAEKY